MLKNTFDLKAHTAKSLTMALKRAQDGMKQSMGARRKKNEADALPFMPAGRRPGKVQDEGVPSRHNLVTQPASMALMINCHNAAFEVIEWSGASPFELPSVQTS